MVRSLSMDHEQHDKHASHSAAMFKERFWLSLALTFPVVVYSPMIQSWFHFTPPSFFMSEYLPLIFSTILMLYAGSVFIKGAWDELHAKQPGMMTLISLAISVSYIYSIIVTFTSTGHDFFWELATLITIMILGHWLEMNSIQKAEGALDDLAKLLPDTAEKIVKGDIKTVEVNTLKVGDVILVRPGASIPIDGKIIEGASSVNEAAITGESQPVSKRVGDEAVGGTINQDGALTVKVTKVGDKTTLAGIMQLVREAQASRSNGQALADKAAFVLTIIAVVTSILTFVVWLLLADAYIAVERAVTVMIIACPHALGLAIPLVVAISTSLAAKNGLLIRKRNALETARTVQWVLFDKTGTLTKGEHSVTRTAHSARISKKDFLQIAASIEAASEHVIGKGIVAYAKQQDVDTVSVTDFTAIAGVGVQARYNDATYKVVSARYLEEQSLSLPTDLQDMIAKAHGKGETDVYLVKEKEVLGVFSLADEIKPEAKAAIEALHNRNIKTAMITGDSNKVAQQVAQRLYIDTVFSEVKPGDKAEKVKELQSSGEVVAMVGDGINDAPALTQADIGIAIGAGTDIAIKSADVILMRSDPRDVVKIIELSHATWNKMVQNLIWATGYNIIAIPLAAGVLAFAGILLSPAAGAILMSLSTVVVALNAQLLRKIRL